MNMRLSPRFSCVLFYLAQVLCLLGFAGAQTRGAAILFVVGNTSLGVGDQWVYDRLLSQGHVVSLVSDSASNAGQADNADLVMISSTVNSGNVNTKFRDVSKPVIVWEPFLFDDMGMTGLGSESDYGSVNSQTSLTIISSAHPLAAGLTGTQSVMSSGQTFSWGVPSVAAAVAARQTGSSSRAVIFAYETGALMVGHSAPSRRVGFLLSDTSAPQLNANGVALFDAAITWAGNMTPPAAPMPGVPELMRLPETLAPSNRRSGLVISEIMYNPSVRADGRDVEFVEIYNTQPFSQDIGGYRLSGEVDFTFAVGTILAGASHIVVARVPSDVEAAYGITGVLGPYIGGLSNAGGMLRLEHRNGAVLQEVEYSDQEPWPVAADGAGHSLVLAFPSYGEDDPAAWRASAYRGGTPGSLEVWPVDPLDALVINELLSHTDLPDVDFVELYNHGTNTLDISGCMITDGVTTNGAYVIPAGTVLAPGGFYAVNQVTSGIAFTAAGEQVLIWNSAATRVLDGFRFGASQNGVAFARIPNGSPLWSRTSQKTFGGPNAGFLIQDIVINEIMYNPPGGDTNHEFIELFNKGNQSVDMSNWQMMAGIAFVFPVGTTIPPGGYLVLAKNREQILARYPGLDPSIVVGNYSGSLANSGERIALAKPDNPALPLIDFVVIDEVTYRDGGEWPERADGAGSSLELIHPGADNRHPSNWAASDESAKAAWTTLSFTGLLDHGENTPNELQVLAFDAGEWLIDRVVVRAITDAPGGNRIGNGDFEAGISSWVVQGNHIGSRHEPTEGADGSGGSFRLVASGGGDNGVNRVETDLTSALSVGSTATIEAKVRWISGATNLLFRLHGNYLEAVVNVAMPTHLGTPGAQNSAYQATVGPAIVELDHRPVLPAAMQDVAVSVRVHDPEGVASVQLLYRVDPLPVYTALTMRDTGTHGDLLAGDGIFTAFIPGQPASKIVEYYIEASDNGMPSAIRRYPRGAPIQTCLVRFGEVAQAGDFAAYRFWMTQATLTEWETRQRLSNELLPGTFVYGDSRVIHTAGARFRGSPFIRPNYTSPVSGNVPNLMFSLPKDQRLLRARSLNMDGLEQPGRDNTLLRERMAFWLAEQKGDYHIHQRFVHMFMNGVKRGELYADTQQPNSDYLEAWFPGEDNGELFEVDDWFEFNDNTQVTRLFNINATLQNFTTTGGAKKQARYRWNWEKKVGVGTTGDSYQGVFDLVDAVNSLVPAPYDANVRALVDLENWFGHFALRRVCGDWDGYGYNRGKNAYIYRPPGGKWKLIPWDLDFSLGAGSRSVTHNLFAEINDPLLQVMYNHPPFQRVYWRNLREFALGPMSAGRFDPVIDELYAVLQANGINAVEPSAVKTWVADRRSYVLAQSNVLPSGFVITTNGGNDFTTSSTPVTIEGTAPVDVSEILLNGVPRPVVWTGLNTWSLDVVPLGGSNVLTFTGQAKDGTPVSGATAQITITLTGGSDPLVGNLVVTELMYFPLSHGSFDHTQLEFLELKNIGSGIIDLTGAAFTAGITYAFPSGVRLGPGEFLILASNANALRTAFPWIQPFDSYSGQLSNSGERLTLLDGVAHVVFDFVYDEVAPWPTTPDGQGPSLVRTQANPEGDPGVASNWRASAYVGGSPGFDDPELVPSAPIIIQQPTSLTLAPGEQATFVCLASGFPQPSYQWRVNGVPVPGQTSPALRYAAVTVEQNGSLIDCLVSNSQGQVLSTSAVLLVQTDSPFKRFGEHLIAYYPLTEGSGSHVGDHSGYGIPLDLVFSGSASWLSGRNGVLFPANSALISPGAASKLHQEITATGAFTFEAWIKPANTTQTGPARIMSYSMDVSNRNMTLGQAATSLDVRLRTTTTSNNGLPSVASAPGVSTEPSHFVAAFDVLEGISLYKDGQLIASGIPGGDLSNWNSLHRFVLGNEVTEDRQWQGELYLAAVYSERLTHEQVQQNFVAGSDPGLAVAIPPEFTSVPEDMTISCISQLPEPSTNAVTTVFTCTSSGVVNVAVHWGDGSGCAIDPLYVDYIFIAADFCGLYTTHTQRFTVVDTQPAFINCPGNVAITIVGGCSIFLPDYRAHAVVTNDCVSSGAVTVTQTPVQGSILSRGIHTVTLTATDACGNQSQCSFMVEAVDITKPSIVCPSPYTRTANASCLATVPTVLPIVSDNCSPAGSIVVTQDPPGGTLLPAGLYVITVTATDQSGNQRSCTVPLTIRDATLPSMTCPSPVTLNASADCHAVLPSILPFAVSDNCTPSGSIVITQLPIAGTSLPVGVHSVTLTATDAAGNARSCSVSVTVRDVIPPSITQFPADRALDCLLDLPAPGSIVFSDTCDPAPILMVTTNDLGGAGCAVSPRVIEFRYSVRDAAGNVTNRTQTIVIKDTLAPTIVSCPEGAAWPALADVPAPNLQALVAIDNCATVLVTNVTTTVLTDTPCEIRVRHTYTITDFCGNSTTCHQIHTVSLSPSSAPVWAEEPSDASATPGNTGLFHAQAAACDMVSLQWFRDAAPIAGATNTTYETLPVTDLDRGAEFYCTASSAMGIVTSRVALLTVPTPGQSAVTAPVLLFERTGLDPTTIALPHSTATAVYRLQRANTLVAPHWRNVGPAQRGHGGTLHFQPPEVDAPPEYYRVVGFPD